MCAAHSLLEHKDRQSDRAMYTSLWFRLFMTWILLSCATNVTGWLENVKSVIWNALLMYPGTGYVYVTMCLYRNLFNIHLWYTFVFLENKWQLYRQLYQDLCCYSFKKNVFNICNILNHQNKSQTHVLKNINWKNIKTKQFDWNMF